MSIRNDLLEQILSATGGAETMPVAPPNQFSVAIDDNWVDSKMISGSPLYNFSTDTSGSAPLESMIKLNNSNYSSVTEIYISYTTENGSSIKEITDKMQGLDSVSISEYLNNTNYISLTVTGNPVDNSTYATIPVVINSFGSDINNGSDVQLRLIATSPRVEAAQIERLIDAEATDLTQNPTGIGVANSIVMNFGAAVGTVNDPVMVDANGVLKINKSGLYRIKVSAQYGRVGSGGTALLLFGAFINGVQSGRSIFASIPNANADVYFENDSWLNLPAGIEIEYRLMRDSAGSDTGGLIGFNPSIDGGSEWNYAPSAALRVERLVSCDGVSGNCF